MAWTKSGIFYTSVRDQWNSSNLGLDLDAETWRCAFFGSSVTPNFTQDAAYGIGTWGSSNESSGAGYTAGGPVLPNTTLTFVGNRLVWDADNVQLTNSTITAEGVLLYYPDKSNRALAAIWFGSPKETQDGTFLINWSSDGIIGFTIP